MIEIVAVVAIMGILTAGAALTISRFGARGKVRYEAERLVDRLWDLRSRAVTGISNPCLDFPTIYTVRLYSDTSGTPDGFGAGDPVIETYTFSGGVKTLSVSGGTGATHWVCFESRGAMGAAGSPLLITLGADSLTTRKVRLLPSTGMARSL